MKSKEYYQALVDIFEYACNNDCQMIDIEIASSICGLYWPNIRRDFVNAGAGVPLSGGGMSLTQPQYLNPLYADALAALEEIEKIEADRELDNLEKRENIRYGRLGYRISLAALILSAIAIGIELIRLL